MWPSLLYCITFFHLFGTLSYERMITFKTVFINIKLFIFLIIFFLLLDASGYFFPAILSKLLYLPQNSSKMNIEYAYKNILFFIWHDQYWVGSVYYKTNWAY
jgi:dolichol kinase